MEQKMTKRPFLFNFKRKKDD
ncbi:hypothetical protein LBKG_01373 [Lactobacillus crispatus CTV-05]|nr:hypothetical protein LBKG_01373 [Lactobacillus crispatus CTV-05]